MVFDQILQAVIDLLITINEQKRALLISAMNFISRIRCGAAWSRVGANNRQLR